jgi:hypothetical protein
MALVDPDAVDDPRCATVESGVGVVGRTREKCCKVGKSGV